MGDVAFSQQGAVNWDQLGSNGLTYAFNVAGRISAKGIDTYTISVGSLGIGGLFSLSEKGQARVDEALAKATCFESFSKLLYFGVGIEHVNRQLAKTVQGMHFLVLANSLTEIFDIDTSARVMLEIFKQTFPKERLHPALRQWNSLLKSTAGFLSRTGFARIVEQFMAYYDPAEYKDGRRRRYGEEADIAHALRLLFRIVRDDNSLTRVNLTGGATCGFIAAFGYYFLGLEVEIWEPRRKKERKSKTERRILFRSCSLEKPANIIVEYEYQRSSTLRKPPETTLNLAVSNKPTVESASFIVHDIYDVIKPPNEVLKTSFTEPTLGGRIPWSTLLSEGFPTAGDVLLKHGKQLASFLGNAARILEYAARHNETSQEFRVRLSPEQYGSGYIENAMTFFPELKEFEDDMRLGYTHPIMIAMHQYQGTAIFLEKKLKECGTCITTHYLVLFLVYAFTSMVIPEGLYPTRKGILSLRFGVFSEESMFYEAHTEDDLLDESPYEIERKTGSVCLPEVTLFSVPSLSRNPETEHLHWRMIEILEPRAVMYSAACLFGNAAPIGFGGTYDVAVKTLKQTNGFSINGLTFAYGVLLRITNNPFHASRVYIVPGCIEAENGCAYTKLEDFSAATTVERTAFSDDSDDWDSDLESDESRSTTGERVENQKTSCSDRSEATRPSASERTRERLDFLETALLSVPGIKELAIEMTNRPLKPTAGSKPDRQSFIKHMLRCAYKIQTDEASQPQPKLVATQIHPARGSQPTTFSSADHDDVLALSIEFSSSKIGPFAFIQLLSFGILDSTVPLSRITATTTSGTGGCKNPLAMFNCGLRELNPESLPFVIPELVWNADKHTLKLQNRDGSVSRRVQLGLGPSSFKGLS